MGVILWIIFGALAGWIASMITGDDARQGAFGNIVVGIIGAFLGGLLMSIFGAEGVTGFDLRSLFVAIGGAVLLLFLINLFTSRPHPVE